MTIAAAGWGPFRRRTSVTSAQPIADRYEDRFTKRSLVPLSGMAVRSYVGAVRAPDFPEGLDWLNVSRPLHIQDLRGRLAIIDFWTFC